jgi:3'(2'), 5'-bisphosphate nucleotidase
LKFSLLADGEADLYPRLAPTMAWDTAAGQALLEAAGGAVVRPDGTRLLCSRAAGLRNRGFIAARSGAIAARAIQLAAAA